MVHFAKIKMKLSSSNCNSEGSGSDEFSPQSIKGGTSGVRKKIFVSALAVSLLLAGLSWHTDVHKNNAFMSRSLMNIFDRSSPSENTVVSANRKKKDKLKTPKATKPPTIKTTKAPTIKTTKTPTAKKNKKRGTPRASVTYTASNAVSSLTSLLEDSRSFNSDGYNSSGSTGVARAKGKGSYTSDCVDEDDVNSKGSTGKGGKGKGDKGKGGKGKGSDYSLGKGGKGGKGKGNKSRRLKSGSSKGYSKGKGSSYSKGSGKGGSKGSHGSSKGSASSKGGKGKGGCYYNYDQPSTNVATTPSPTPANIVTTATPTGSTDAGCTTVCNHPSFFTSCFDSLKSMTNNFFYQHSGH